MKKCTSRISKPYKKDMIKKYFDTEMYIVHHNKVTNDNFLVDRQESYSLIIDRDDDRKIIMRFSVEEFREFKNMVERAI